MSMRNCLDLFLDGGKLCRVGVMVRVMVRVMVGIISVFIER